MKAYNVRRSLLDMPGIGTHALVAANVAVFVLTLLLDHSLTPSGMTLYRLGALYREAIAHQEYWRLVAATFLHGGGLHILFNMIFLLSCGAVLEGRVGLSYYLAIYLVSGLSASVASVLGHHVQFIGIGASGAISGIVGALMTLWLRGRLAVNPNFFVSTILLNAVILFTNSHIDWMAHLGGFAGGLIVTALLDLAEGQMGRVLATKFPESIKLGLGLVLVPFGLGLAARSGDLLPAPPWLMPAIIVVAMLGIIKLADRLLTRTKGAAHAILMLVPLLAAAPLLLGASLERAVYWQCSFIENPASLAVSVCGAAPFLPWILAIAAPVLYLVLMRGELRAGLADTGHIAPRLRLARQRSTGL